MARIYNKINEYNKTLYFSLLYRNFALDCLLKQNILNCLFCVQMYIQIHVCKKISHPYPPTYLVLFALAFTPIVPPAIDHFPLT